jgi:putative inorganic carbon (hco3(-)) transporter
MPLKTSIYGMAFAVVLIAALYSPIWGICGYMLNYCIGPERQWWAESLRSLGIRFSFMLAAVTAIGTLLNFGKLQFGRNILIGQEKLLLLFLAFVWLSTLLGEPTVGAYTIVDHPTVKMTKIIVLVFLLTHIVTNLKDLNLLLWTFTTCALWLGVEAYRVPYGAFAKGRLETVGGLDFTESNFLAAFVAMIMPLVGLQFLRARWIGKLYCLTAGAFAANLLILTRSRGAILGLAIGGVMAVLFAPRQVRLKIMAYLLLAALGFFSMTDPYYLTRASTITNTQESLDVSAQSRIRLAQAAMQILSDHPLGIGVGNYFQVIGRYIPEYQGKDAHNTYLRCATEMGVQGLLVFLLLIANAFFTLRRTWVLSSELPEEHRENLVLICYGMAITLVVLLGCCLTISLTYVEFLWWLLALPVCIERTTQNLCEEAVFADELDDEYEICEEYREI